MERENKQEKDGPSDLVPSRRAFRLSDVSGIRKIRLY